MAQQLFSRLHITEMHTVPGEHDTTDATVSEYFNRFGKASADKGYYSFDHAGVHFIALINVLEFKPGGLGTLGEEQLAWVAADLKGRSASTPIVVFAHMPLWTIRVASTCSGSDDHSATAGLSCARQSTTLFARRAAARRGEVCLRISLSEGQCRRRHALPRWTF